MKNSLKYKVKLSYILLIFLAVSCSTDDDTNTNTNTRLKKITQTRNGSIAGVAEFSYDTDNKLTQVNNTLSGVVETVNYQYNQLGQLIDDDGYSYSYNTSDKIASIINSVGDTLTFNYNSQNLVETVQSTGGTYNATTNFTYNSSNQLTERSYNLIGIAESGRNEFTYNGDGNLINQKRYITSSANPTEVLLQDFNITYLQDNLSIDTPIKNAVGIQDNNVFGNLGIYSFNSVNAFEVNTSMIHFINNNGLFKTLSFLQNDGTTTTINYTYEENNGVVTKIIATASSSSGNANSISSYDLAYETY